MRNENKWVRDVIEKVGCHVQFNTWMGRIPREAAIDWHSLPESLYGCIPESLNRQEEMTFKDLIAATLTRIDDAIEQQNYKEAARLLHVLGAECERQAGMYEKKTG